MDLLSINDRTLASLYELFKDNNKVFVTEDEKYAKGTQEILKLKELDIKELRDLRNQFVKIMADLIHATRIMMEMESNLSKLYNVYSNMLQYVTAEIDFAIVKLGGEV